MKSLTLGIVAHVDAGKTSLTERLLHAAGVIDEIGSVDDGSTQTDSLALERQRGITIKSAVVAFAIGDVAVNLVDTPGHPDFIAEVERALTVLDGAVLVISAVEGVQPQTRILMRTLQRLRIPTLIFVNKVDRRGARRDGVLRDIAAKLTPAIVGMGAVDELGLPTATFRGYGASDAAFATQLAELLADHDDRVLAAYVDGRSGLAYPLLRAVLGEQTKQALVFPVFFGSAVTGAGVPELVAGVAELLPADRGDVEAPVSGTVFKIERGTAGERIAYARVFAGRLAVRDRLSYGRNREAKVTGLDVFSPAGTIRDGVARAGDIARVRGLDGVRIGDSIGVPHPCADRQFAPPSMETVVSVRRIADRGRLYAALAELAEQDPLINLRVDEMRQEVAVSLYGEVQKEVIQATLFHEHGLDVTFSEATTICIERVNGSGAASETIATDPNPFLATVGLRIEPAPAGSGIDFRLGVELGSMPLAFFNAVEETLRKTLRQGLYGWQVVDCVAIMTHSGYWARQSHMGGGFDKSMSSTAGDFRNLTPLVLMDALKVAGTTVCEPMHAFRLDVPDSMLAAVVPALASYDATPLTTTAVGAWCAIEGEIRAARLHDLERRLPSLTSGEGVLETVFDHYRPVRGAPPARARTDHNPLERREYLLHVQRRV